MRIFNTDWHIKSSFPFLEWKPTPPNGCCGNIRSYLKQGEKDAKQLQEELEHLGED